MKFLPLPWLDFPITEEERAEKRGQRPESYRTILFASFFNPPFAALAFVHKERLQ